MPIEVRQLTIKAQVGEPAAAAPPQGAQAGPAQSLDELRAELLAECKAWLEDRLLQLRER